MEIMEFCAKHNEAAFNYLKAIEENGEFTEVLVKLQTKANTKKPDPKEAIKEFGDVIFRGAIALKTIFPELSFEQIDKEVSDHIEMKLGKLEGYRKEGKYKGGL